MQVDYAVSGALPVLLAGPAACIVYIGRESIERRVLKAVPYGIVHRSLWKFTNIGQDHAIVLYFWYSLELCVK